MKCSAYIATPEGGVDWPHTSGNLGADMGSEDMGFQSFIDSIDCIIMGRKCMEMISKMNLSRLAAVSITYNKHLHLIQQIRQVLVP